MSLKKVEIEFDGPSLRFRNINPSKENVWEYFLAQNVKSITTNYILNIRSTLPDGSKSSTYPYDNKFEVQINFLDENDTTSFNFDIQSIDNQPTWTANLAGLFQAVSDINEWLRQAIGSTGDVSITGGATETTLQSVLAAIQAQNDRELVEDKYIAVVDNVGNGYSIGDYLSKLSIFDVDSGSSSLLETIWFNHTTDTILATVDLLELQDQDGPSIYTPGAGSQILPFGTADGILNFLYDCDTLSVDNLTDVVVTIEIDGILGGIVKIPPEVSKTYSFDVAVIGSINYSGINLATKGDVYIHNLRSK